ncbi:hypothetical protein N7522_007569 [Penicillium canescens]|nr:hypothetical protein N7522_007569 [Penicillium canescens]
MPPLSEGIYARSTAPSSRAVELIIVSSIFTALAILFCGMRLYTRRVLVKIVGVDDWIVTIATEKILSFFQTIVNTLGNCHPCHPIVEAAMYHADPGLIASHEIWSWIQGQRLPSELFTDLNRQSMEIGTTS